MLELHGKGQLIHLSDLILKQMYTLDFVSREQIWLKSLILIVRHFDKSIIKEDGFNLVESRFPVQPLPWVNLDRHEPESRVALDEEHDCAAAIIFVSVSVDKADELPSTEVNDTLRHVLGHMNKRDLSVIWTVAIIRKDRVVGNPALLQRLLRIFELKVRGQVLGLVVRQHKVLLAELRFIPIKDNLTCGWVLVDD